MAERVLIIDDDPEFTASTSDVLEGGDFQVTSSLEGASGFEKAKSEHPDIILLDVMIEDAGTGLDVARKLRDDEATSGIPVIMMTGIRRADQLLSSYAPGEGWPNIKATLEKPVEPEFLIKTVRKALG